MFSFGLSFIDYAENIYFPSVRNNIKESSYKNFKWLYKKYLKTYWSHKKLKTITCNDVQIFYNFLADLNLSKATINRGILGLFRTILNDAARNGKMPVLLLKLKTPIKLTKKEREKKMLKKEDYDKLIEILKQPLNKFIYRQAKVFCIISLCEGLRIGEVCGLKWGDIDFSNKTISISRTVQRVYDADTKKSNVIVSTPKTTTSERIIPMLDFVAEKLEEFSKIYQNLINKTYGKYIADIKDFYILGGVSPVEPRVVRSSFERFLNAYDIEYINPHGLRHTFCTNAIDNGAPSDGISKMLGHANEIITLNVYKHLTEEKEEKTVDVLNAMIKK